MLSGVWMKKLEGWACGEGERLGREKLVCGGGERWEVGLEKQVFGAGERCGSEGLMEKGLEKLALEKKGSLKNRAKRLSGEMGEGLGKGIFGGMKLGVTAKKIFWWVDGERELGIFEKMEIAGTMGKKAVWKWRE